MFCQGANLKLGNELQKITKADQIIQLKLQGKSVQAIALALNSDRKYVQSVIREFEDEARANLIAHAENLLALDVARLEVLIERLMMGSLDGDYAALDRLIKVMKLKSDIILKTRPNAVTIKGDADNPVQHTMEHVFTVNSPEYQAAITALQQKDKEAMLLQGQSEATIKKFTELPDDIREDIIEGDIEEIIQEIDDE